MANLGKDVEVVTTDPIREPQPIVLPEPQVPSVPDYNPPLEPQEPNEPVRMPERVVETPAVPEEIPV